MEGIASGFAVASLSIQLVECAAKLHGFLERFQNAPKDIDALATDLRHLSDGLKEFRPTSQLIGPARVLKPLWESCFTKTAELSGFLQDVESGLTSSSPGRRAWSAFQATLRSSRIKELKDALHFTQQSLLLVQQQLPVELGQQSIERIVEGITAIQPASNRALLEQIPSSIVPLIQNLQADLQADFNMTRMTNLRLVSQMECLMTKMALDHSDSRPGAHGNQCRHPRAEPHGSSDSEVNADDQGCRTVSSEGGLKKRKGVRQGMGCPFPKRQRTLCIHRTQCSETPYALGKVYVLSKTYHSRRCQPQGHNPCVEARDEFETTITIHPGSFLLRWGIGQGLKISFGSSVQGFKHHLTTYRAVPDDSLIFKYCKMNDIGGVQRLFRDEKASPWDTNSRGWTPLLFAAQHCNVELCKFLLSQGAEEKPTAPDPKRAFCSFQTPLLVAAAWDCTVYPRDLHARIDTLRLFIDSTDFESSRCEGWNLLQCFGRTYLSAKFGYGVASPVLSWLLGKLKDDITHNFFEDSVRYLLGHLIHQGRVKEMEQLLDAVKRGLPSETIQNDLGNLALYLVNLHYTQRPSQSQPALECLRDLGFDFHGMGLRGPWGTPTSEAMWSSLSFFRWRQDLVALGFDLKDFVKQELTTAALVDAGWREDTLLSLFFLDFRPYRRVYQHCDAHHVQVWPYERWWNKLLDDVKERRFPYYDVTGQYSEVEREAADIQDEHVEEEYVEGEEEQEEQEQEDECTYSHVSRSQEYYGDRSVSWSKDYCTYMYVWWSKEDYEIPLWLGDGTRLEDLQFDEAGHPFVDGPCLDCKESKRKESGITEEADDSDYAPFGLSLPNL